MTKQNRDTTSELKKYKKNEQKTEKQRIQQQHLNEGISYKVFLHGVDLANLEEHHSDVHYHLWCTYQFNRSVPPPLVPHSTTPCHYHLFNHFMLPPFHSTTTGSSFNHYPHLKQPLPTPKTTTTHT